MPVTDTKAPPAPFVLTAVEFRRICELIWGQYWQPAASRALKKSVRTLQYYANGKTIPPAVRSRLASHAAIRGEELMDVARDLIA